VIELVIPKQAERLVFKRIAIFGVGLIGGSFALALKKAGAVAQVVGVGRKRETLEQAQRLGLIDQIAEGPDAVAQALKDCDLVLIAAPVAQTGAILASILPYLDAHTIVTDAGSTKSEVVAAARAALGDKIGQFVPGHPIAGREVHGPEAALAHLYQGKRVILTPLPENSAQSLAVVRQAWELCGAQVDTLSALQHDAVLAAVSHLPHMLAYALVAQIARAEDAQLKFGLAASGFRDFTRIAASSPEMWRDIALGNREALLDEIKTYQQMLEHLRGLIERKDAAGMEQLFALASEKRLSLNRPK
jgi:prephenate dehydrogenase